MQRKERGREGGRGVNLPCDCRGQGGSTTLKFRSLHNIWETATAKVRGAKGGVCENGE